MSRTVGGEVDGSLVDNDLLLVRSGSRGCRECREVDSSVVDVGGLLVAGTVASDVDGGTDYVTFVVVGGLELGPVLMLSNVDSAGAVGGLLMMRRGVVMMRLFEGWFRKVVTTGVRVHMSVRMVLLRLQRIVRRVVVVVVLGLGNDHRTNVGAVGAMRAVGAVAMVVGMDMLRLVHLDDIVVGRVVGVRTVNLVNEVVLVVLVVVFLVPGRVSAVDVGELVSEVVNEVVLVLLVVLLLVVMVVVVMVVVALVLVKMKVRDMG